MYTMTDNLIYQVALIGKTVFNIWTQGYLINFYLDLIISSHDLIAQSELINKVYCSSDFSDHLLSGVCISFRLCMYVFLHFRLLNSEPLNDFQPNLVQSFIWLRSLLSSLIVQMVQRGDIKENKERIHNRWNVLKNILLKNQIHVVYNAQNCTQAS